MWDKIKEIGLIILGYSYLIFVIVICVLIPVKCSIAIIDRIQNPPSEIYAENQELDKWKRYCKESDSEDCFEYANRIKTKSFMYVNDDKIDIIAVIELDDYNMQMSITLRDWNTGDIIQPFPQEKYKWYEFYKSYESYESVGFLLDEEEENPMGYELTVFRNKIIINEDSCDSRGYEEANNIQGGCFFFEQYDETEWHYLSIKFEDNFSVIISL